jgi:hypothetical protein
MGYSPSIYYLDERLRNPVFRLQIPSLAPQKRLIIAKNRVPIPVTV